MNHANHAIDHVDNAKTYLELLAEPATINSHNDATDGDCPLSTADCAADQPFFAARADRQVREDRSFYVPDLLSDKDYDTDPQAYAAAGDYAEHLRDAERLLCEVQDLVGLMRAAISDECDARAMQAETALTIIEKKLRKINKGVDKHDRRHTNLFLAYVDLKIKTEDDAE